MGSTLWKTTYSLREDIFQAMLRREKSLSSHPVSWLKNKLKKDLNISKVNKTLKKSQLIWLIMELQYGERRMEVFFNIKIERSAPKHP